jgi:ABC-2 type transport system permease protein
MTQALSIIVALINAQWKSLVRDRLALLLTFVLPCILFTVLAVIFGGIGPDNGGPNPLSVVVRDEDRTTTSGRMISALQNMSSLKVTMSPATTANAGETSGETAAAANPAASTDLRKALATEVRRGVFDAAVLFPTGIEDSLLAFGTERPAIEVIYDAANPMAQQVLAGVLQGAAFTAAPDILIQKGLDQFQLFGGPLTSQQQTAVTLFRTFSTPADTGSASDVNSTDGAVGDAPSATALSMENGLVRIATTAAREVTDVTQAKTGLQRQGAMISYYAAGIAVMFLMFSMAGAAAALLDHQENGTLERLLSGRLSIAGLVIAHWLFYALMGVMQVAVMFVFAAVAFGLDLWHVPTLICCGVLSVCTSLASAAFIMLLATICRSRQQLEGMSTIVILIMSALGGSMVPRFVMPEFIHQTSRLTFNGWALDGFLKVFWYNVPGESMLLSILPEVAVLLAMAAVFLGIAMKCAQRWSVA